MNVFEDNNPLIKTVVKPFRCCSPSDVFMKCNKNNNYNYSESFRKLVRVDGKGAKSHKLGCEFFTDFILLLLYVFNAFQRVIFNDRE